MPHAAAKMAHRDRGAGRYQRHRPEQTLLYQIVEEYYPAFTTHLTEQGRELPGYVQREFEDYLKCGRLEHGFLRVRCASCHTERLVAFSCKRRGFCPSCGARRMAENAALLVDEVLPRQPMRQLLPWMACSRAMQERLPWVLSFPFPLRFLFASRPGIMGRVLGIVYRVIATYLVKKAGYTHHTARTGAVTLIQRFGSALTKSPGAILNSRRLAQRVEGRMPGIASTSIFHPLVRDRHIPMPLLTCFSSMACMSITSMELPVFVGSRRRPARNSPNWRTPSPSGSAAFWNARVCWNETRRTATWPRMRWTTRR